MWMAVLFLLLGLLSIAIEFFTPGGLFAVIGAILLMSGVFVFAKATESMALGFIFFLVSLFLVVLLIYGMMVWLRKGGLKSSIYSSDDQEGYVASNWDKSLVGKKGIVSTELRPGGHIRIEGKQSPAISQSGFVDRGEEVEVVGGEGDTLLVKKS